MTCLQRIVFFLYTINLQIMTLRFKIYVSNLCAKDQWQKNNYISYLYIPQISPFSMGFFMLQNQKTHILQFCKHLFHFS